AAGGGDEAEVIGEACPQWQEFAQAEHPRLLVVLILAAAPPRCVDHDVHQPRVAVARVQLAEREHGLRHSSLPQVFPRPGGGVGVRPTAPSRGSMPFRPAELEVYPRPFSDGADWPTCRTKALPVTRNPS